MKELSIEIKVKQDNARKLEVEVENFTLEPENGDSVKFRNTGVAGDGYLSYTINFPRGTPFGNTDNFTVGAGTNKTYVVTGTTKDHVYDYEIISKFKDQYGGGTMILDPRFIIGGM